MYELVGCMQTVGMISQYAYYELVEYSSGIMDTVLHWWRLDIDVLLRYAASWPPGSPEPYTHTSFPQNCLRSSSSFSIYIFIYS